MNRRGSDDGGILQNVKGKDMRFLVDSQYHGNCLSIVSSALVRCLKSCWWWTQLGTYWFRGLERIVAEIVAEVTTHSLSIVRDVLVAF